MRVFSLRMSKGTPFWISTPMGGSQLSRTRTLVLYSGNLVLLFSTWSTNMTWITKSAMFPNRKNITRVNIYSFRWADKAPISVRVIGSVSLIRRRSQAPLTGITRRFSGSLVFWIWRWKGRSGWLGINARSVHNLTIIPYPLSILMYRSANLISTKLTCPLFRGITRFQRSWEISLRRSTKRLIRITRPGVRDSKHVRVCKEVLRWKLKLKPLNRSTRSTMALYRLHEPVSHPVALHLLLDPYKVYVSYHIG